MKKKFPPFIVHYILRYNTTGAKLCRKKNVAGVSLTDIKNKSGRAKSAIVKAGENGCAHTHVTMWTVKKDGGSRSAQIDLVYPRGQRTPKKEDRIV